MPLLSTLSRLFARGRQDGDSVAGAFPPGHRHALTRWDPAIFEIDASQDPDAIEDALCSAIDNTPGVFAYIVHPTPRMQARLLAAIEARLRLGSGAQAPTELVGMLIDAYDSADTPEALPGLRAAIASTEGYDPSMRVAHLTVLLADLPAGGGIIEAGG